MENYLNIWASWTDIPQTLSTRYEDQLNDFDTFITRIVNYLNLKIPKQEIEKIKSQYLPKQPAADGKKTHFSTGKAHRFKTEFTKEQQTYLAERFGPILEKMGYDTL